MGLRPGQGVEPCLHHLANVLGLILSRGAHPAGEPLGGVALPLIFITVNCLLTLVNYLFTLYTKLIELRFGLCRLCKLSE